MPLFRTKGSSAEEELEPYAPHPISIAPSDLRFGSWFQKRVKLAHSIAALALAALILYLSWRLAYTSEGVSPWAFTPLFLAELYGFLTFLIFLIDTWELPEMPRLAPLKLSCDIVIPTYDEDIEIVEPTIIGALEVRGKTKVWLLDDGRRPEMAQLAKRYGIQYRTRDNNLHAKAGNINAVLGDLKSDLLLVIDADHVPSPDFLEATTGYFGDPKVALVQTAHSFRNQNSVAHDNGARNDQSLFFDVIMPGKNRINAVFWCGSAAILRRSALLEVGGLSTISIIEDFETSIQMRRAGYKSIYHNEHLIQGLAPDNLQAHVIQKHRWAKGLFQLYRPSVLLPLKSELGKLERVSYLGALLYYLSPIQKFFYTANMVAVACFALLPVSYTGKWYLFLWVLATSLNLLAVTALERGTTQPFEGMRNSFIVLEAYLTALPALWSNKNFKFKVTPKNQIDLGGWQAVRLLRIPIAIAVLTSIAILTAWSNLFFNSFLGIHLGHPVSLSTVLVITAFGASEIFVIARTAWFVFHRKQMRSLWRFPVRLEAKLAGERAQCIDLHQLGAAFIVSASVIDGRDIFPVAIQVRDVEGKSHIALGNASVRSRRFVADSEELVRVGCHIEWEDDESRSAVIKHCYVVEQYVARKRFWVRRDTRFAVHLASELSGFPAICNDLSNRGASFTLKGAEVAELTTGKVVPVSLGNGLTGAGTIRSISKTAGAEYRIGVEMRWESEDHFASVAKGLEKSQTEERGIAKILSGVIGGFTP